MSHTIRMFPMFYVPIASEFVHSFHFRSTSKYFYLLYYITACEKNNIKQYRKILCIFITLYIYNMIKQNWKFAMYWLLITCIPTPVRVPTQWGLGLLCWGFKWVQEEIPSEEASTLQIGSVAFLPGQCTSTQLNPCHRLFDTDGHQDSSSPSV